MKGNISNNVIGAFKNVRKKGNIKLASKFLKNDISSKIFKTTPKVKKAKQIKKNFLKNFFWIYFS